MSILDDFVAFFVTINTRLRVSYVSCVPCVFPDYSTFATPTSPLLCNSRVSQVRKGLSYSVTFLSICLTELLANVRLSCSNDSAGKSYCRVSAKLLNEWNDSLALLSFLRQKFLYFRLITRNGVTALWTGFIPPRMRRAAVWAAPALVLSLQPFR